MRIRAHGHPKCACEPKVGKLEDLGVALLVAPVLVLRDEQVLRLEVAVQDTVRVAKTQARRQLVCEFL